MAAFRLFLTCAHGILSVTNVDASAAGSHLRLNHENVISLLPNCSLLHTAKPDPYNSVDPTTQAALVLRRDLFLNDSDIRYYALLVSEREFIEQPLHGVWNGEDWPPSPKWQDARLENGTVSTYQATPAKWEPFRNVTGAAVTYTIGAGECYRDNYCNMPLKENGRYAVKVRAFSLGEYRDTEVIYFETLEHLPLSLICAVLGGIFAAGAVAVVLAAAPPDFLHLPGFSSGFRSKRSSSILHKSFSLKKFAKLANDLLTTEDRLSNEFHLLGSLSSDFSTLCLHGQRIGNREKNRYVNILPFDVTRVELAITDGDPSTDYINANYIKGHRHRVEYIASQGPMKETCHDFYRMILEQNVELIVMLTQLEENGIEQCYKYYPDFGSSLKFKDISVECLLEENVKFWVMRKLLVKTERDEISVTHLHFENWLLFGGSSCGGLIELCEFARQIAPAGCILVHDSAGIGRSGTFIALDILLQKIKEGDKISIFNTVLELRKQRVNMVRTLGEYSLIYRCIGDVIRNHLDAKKLNSVRFPSVITRKSISN